MQLNTKFLRLKYRLRSRGDYFTTLFFRYHKLFFGRLILNGKKIRAFNQFVEIKKILKNKENFDPSLVFLFSMMKLSPIIFLIPMKLGGLKQGIPMPISPNKKVTFGVKWIAQLSKNNRRKISIPVMANFLILSLYDKGPVIEKKKNTYNVATQNRHLINFFN